MKKTLLPLSLLAACGGGQTPEPFGVPITGGTMIISNDGQRAIVADPDRDRVVTMDLATGVAIKDLALDPGDEPGRLVEDALGRVHVGLRRGGALLTIGTDGQQVSRRYACTEPRGVAYDGTANLVHVACAGGELVTFSADGGDAPVRSLRLERDLRDIIVQANGNLLVTKFRTAEILTIGTGGTVLNRQLPPAVQRFDQFGGGVPEGPVGSEPGNGVVNAAASTAWRTIAMPDGTVLMSHQRKTRDRLDETQPGGYGGGCGVGPVANAVTKITPGGAGVPEAIHRIGNGALPVDIATTKLGDKIAVLLAGSRSVTVVSSIAKDEPDRDDGCEPPPPPPPCEDSSNGECCGQVPVPPGGPRGEDAGGMGGTSSCCRDDNFDGRCDDDDDQGEDRKRLGTPTSVAFTPNGDLVIFYPEAPALVIRAAGGPNISRRIDLPGKAAFDPGRSVFHTQTAIGLACASCHPEGRDDGLVWGFAALGNRRTQSLAGNILARAPYHWTGDESSLPVLMDDVFSSRMSGGFLTDNQKAALGPWLDRIPAAPALVLDQAAVARGKSVFDASGCVGCHNGAILTNNTLVNVGTGGKFKVPSLLGVGARAPFMHDGCAKTLMDRFVSCGGGDLHGATSALSETQLIDLTTYLDSL